MRLSGGKHKLDYLLASIADYLAPLLFFITLFCYIDLFSIASYIYIIQIYRYRYTLYMCIHYIHTMILSTYLNCSFLWGGKCKMNANDFFDSEFYNKGILYGIFLFVVLFLSIADFSSFFPSSELKFASVFINVNVVMLFTNTNYVFIFDCDVIIV